MTSRRSAGAIVAAWLEVADGPGDEVRIRVQFPTAGWLGSFIFDRGRDTSCGRNRAISPLEPRALDHSDRAAARASSDSRSRSAPATPEAVSALDPSSKPDGTAYRSGCGRLLVAAATSGTVWQGRLSPPQPLSRLGKSGFSRPLVLERQG